MALTQGLWLPQTSINGHSIWKNTTAVAVAGESDEYTLKTPVALNTYESWTIYVNIDGATLDGSALAVDIWGGFTNDFALTGDTTTVAATDGDIVLNQAMDDVKGTMLSFTSLPNYTGAVVLATLAGVGGHANLGTMPYYAFNLDGGTALTASTSCVWMLVQ